MQLLNHKNPWIILFFAILALSLLSPLSSALYVPNNSDFLNYIGAIVQAKLALTEGQFPLRVAPWQYDGWRYPFFQFYSPLTFTIAGAIYRWIVPNNPLIAFKMVLWTSLILSGFYAYRLAYWFVRSLPAALLSATVYVTAPFYLITLSIQGNLPQCLAIALLPFTLFYTIKLHAKPRLKYFLLVALAWFMLLTTHLLTFIYTSIFAGLCLICLNIQYQISLFNILKVGCAYLYGCVLGLWFLAPVILFSPYLYVQQAIRYTPAHYNWLTPLTALFSARAINPDFHTVFCVSFGWPLLFAIGFIAYQLVFGKEKKPLFLRPLFYIFLISAFMIWSPFDFWIFLPKIFSVVQFSFRLMIQAMWIGIPLFAWAIFTLFQKKLDARHVVVGIFLIGFVHSAWLPTINKIVSVSDVVKQPYIDHTSARYIYAIDPNIYAKKPYPIALKKGILKCEQAGDRTLCHVLVRAPGKMITLPILYYPSLLKITANQKLIPYQPILYSAKFDRTPTNVLLTGIQLTPGNYQIAAQFKGLWWANVVSLIGWLGVIFILRYLIYRTKTNSPLIINT